MPTLHEMIAFGKRVEDFKFTRRYAGGSPHYGHQEAADVLAVAESFFDVVELHFDPSLRSALASLRAARASSTTLELTQHIDEAIKIASVLFVDAMLAGPLPPVVTEADDEDDVDAHADTQAPEPAPLAIVGYSSDDDELGDGIVRALTANETGAFQAIGAAE